MPAAGVTSGRLAHCPSKMTGLRTVVPGAFPALAESPIRRYLLGQTASVLGSWTQNITMNLVLWEMTHAAWQLGLLNFLLYGPSLLVSPVFGARLRASAARRNALLVLSGSVLVASVLCVASLAGWLRPELITAAALCCGVLSAMEMPSRQLLLTTTLKDESVLPNVIALNTLVFNVGRMVGPVIAAFSFVRFGSTGGFALNMLGLSTMLMCIRSLPRDSTTQAAVKHGGLRQAVAYALADQLARQSLPTLAFLGLLAGSYQTLIPVLSSRRFGNAAHYTGVFFACAGAGAMLAALLLSSRALSVRRTMRAHAMAPWAAVVALAGVALTRTPELAGVSFCILGLALTFFATTTNSTLQRDCPTELRGGIVGLYGMAYMGTMPFGHLLMGNIANVIGDQAMFGIMAVTLAICLAAMHFLPRATRQPV